jgi:hypothetical protein
VTAALKRCATRNQQAKSARKIALIRNRRYPQVTGNQTATQELTARNRRQKVTARNSHPKSPHQVQYAFQVVGLGEQVYQVRLLDAVTGG